MARHLALLRAVNLGGGSVLKMADLARLLEELGFPGARTLRQTGNAVFDGTVESPAQLEARFERAATQRLGLSTEFFVRSAKEWAGVVADNPFPAEAERDPAHLVVATLKAAPGADSARALIGAIRGREVARVHGRHAYLVYPDGIGRSKLTLSVLERTLGTRATARNWNTVTALDAELRRP